MLALSFARIAFIPLFLLCNIQPREHIPVVFDSDIAPMVIMVVFAFTNGYFGTLCMIYGPRYDNFLFQVFLWMFIKEKSRACGFQKLVISLIPLNPGSIQFQPCLKQHPSRTLGRLNSDSLLCFLLKCDQEL